LIAQKSTIANGMVKWECEGLKSPSQLQALALP
jgi:hypothetical protein